MRSTAIDMTGRRYGLLVVTGRAPRDPRWPKMAFWFCLCDCGKTKAVRGPTLRNGMTQSCGCRVGASARERFSTHHRSGSREHRAWCAAKTRCTNSKQPGWADYGGRGIRVCPEWNNSFETFLRDMGPCPPGQTIERIDTNRNYEPGNCRWATKTEQANNTRANRFLDHAGTRRTLAEWSRATGLPYDTIKRRLGLGWSVERALTTPVR